MENQQYNGGMPKMSQKIFGRLGNFIEEKFGIKMPPSKITMLQARLQKRLRVLDIATFDEYCDYVLSPQGAETELIHMVDLVSTNKTDFFREPKHFDYLVDHALPELQRTGIIQPGKKVNFWSAGCSSGEEPYTLAMVLSEYRERRHGFDFSILGTDISTRMLETSQNAIYTEDRIAPVPALMKTKYLMRSRDRASGIVRIVPELRQKVHFRRVNFMDAKFPISESIDIIFCRNVVIYFDRPTQEALIHKFHCHLQPGGYLFMGHSETLHGLDVPVVQVAPTIYRRIK